MEQTKLKRPREEAGIIPANKKPRELPTNEDPKFSPPFLHKSAKAVNDKENQSPFTTGNIKHEYIKAKLEHGESDRHDGQKEPGVHPTKTYKASTPKKRKTRQLDEGWEIFSSTETTGALYLGSCEAAQNLEWLVQSGIFAIINVTAEIPNYFSDLFSYLRIPISDSESTNILQYLPQVHQFISQSLLSGSVLVHCQMGQSRSVTVIQSFLISSHSMSLSNISLLFTSKNVPTKINNGFKSQLMEFERTELKFNSVDLLQLAPRSRKSSVPYAPPPQSTTPRRRTPLAEKTLTNSTRGKPQNPSLFRLAR